MAQDTPDQEGTAHAAQMATQKGKLPLDRLMVIGIFGPPQDRRALVRRSSGRVLKVEVGDTLRGAEIEAIEEDRLLLRRGDGLTEMRLPSAG